MRRTVAGLDRSYGGNGRFRIRFRCDDGCSIGPGCAHIRRVDNSIDKKLQTRGATARNQYGHEGVFPGIGRRWGICHVGVVIEIVNEYLSVRRCRINTERDKGRLIWLLKSDRAETVVTSHGHGYGHVTTRIVLRGRCLAQGRGFLVAPGIGWHNALDRRLLRTGHQREKTNVGKSKPESSHDLLR